MEPTKVILTNTPKFGVAEAKAKLSSLRQHLKQFIGKKGHNPFPLMYQLDDLEQDIEANLGAIQKLPTEPVPSIEIKSESRIVSDSKPIGK